MVGCIVTLSKTFPYELVASLQQQSWYYGRNHYIFVEEKNCPHPLCKDITDYFKDNQRLMKKHTVETETLCKGNGARFSPGYRTMCKFWYADFVHFVPEECTYALRVDADLTLFPKEPNPFTHLPRAIASTLFYNSDNAAVTEGMLQFFQSKHFPSLPYSNLMLLNMSWIRSEPVVKIVKAVVTTNCIHHNRWGDLSLWGLTMQAVNETPEKMNVSYYHKSHRKRVLPTRQPS